MSDSIAARLSLDISAYEKSMTRARDLATRHAQDIAGNFQTAAKLIDTSFAALQAGQGFYTLARLPQLARSAAIAFLGFAAVKAVLNEVARASEAAHERLEALVKLARQAQGAGVGTTFLQSLTAQAKTLGVEAGQLVAMLDRAREAATDRIGEGKAATSSAIEDRLRQNVLAGNLAQVDLSRFTNADSQEARIRVILDLLDQLRARGANLAALDLAGKMFGPEFETKLRTGTNMIGAMRRALDGLKAGPDGRIIPPEEIARAESMKQQLSEIDAKLSGAIAPIQRDIALWEAQQLQGWIDIKAQLADVVVLAGQVYTSIKSVGDYISSLGSSKPFQALRDWLDSVGAIDKSEVARIERLLNGGLSADGKPAVPKDADAGGPLQVRVKPGADTSRSLPSLSSRGSGGTDLDEIQRFVDGLNKSAAALKAEADAFGLSNAEKATAINLAKANEIATAAGKTVTEAQTAAIREASTAASNYRDRLQDLEQAQRQAAEAARTFGQMAADSLADAILEGKDFASILNDLTRQLARMALEAVFTGGGPLAGLLGTAPAASAGSSAVGGIAGALGPILGFSTGGHVRGPGTDTSDSILARLSNNEFVVNAAATREHLPLVHAINEGATAEELARLLMPAAGKDGAPPTRREIVTREAERIVYRDRLEAAGVPAASIPPMPEQPTTGLHAAVRAVVMARLAQEAGARTRPAKVGDQPGEAMVRVVNGALVAQAPAQRPSLAPAPTTGMVQLPAFASGGTIKGPGTGTSDSILARVSAGEFVVRAEAAQRHRVLLEQINAGTVTVPRFAAGGLVSGKPAGAPGAGAGPAPSVVTIAPNIHLTAQGSDPAANADLAAKVGQQIEGSIRGLVCDELRRAGRPGGLLNQMMR